MTICFKRKRSILSILYAIKPHNWAIFGHWIAFFACHRDYNKHLAFRKIVYYNDYTPYINVRCKRFGEFFRRSNAIDIDSVEETFMSNNDLFTIGEVAAAIGITRKIVLNYEAKGLIQPDKKDGATGNRYYTIDTFTQIRTIRVFQEFGLSLDEIREYFNDSTDLQPFITRLETLRQQLDLAIEKLKDRSSKQGGVIQEITIDPQTVYCRTYNKKTASILDRTNLLRDTALEAMRKYGTDTTRRMYFTEISCAAPDEESYCVAVPSESEGEYIKHNPEIRALSFFHHGAYEEFSDARDRLITYAKENHIALSGVFRNLYLEGPPQHKDKSKYITQIIAIIE